MKIHTPHIILAGLLGTAMASQGATILVEDAYYATGAQGTATVTSGGSLSLAAGIVDGVSNTATLVYTVSGLDINGSGGTNDTVDITMTVTAKSSNIYANESSTIIGDTSNMQNDLKELTYDFVSMTVNIDGGTDNGLGTFDGFTQVNLGQWASADDTAIVNGESIAQPVYTDGVYSFAAANSLEIIGAAPGTEGFRVGTIDFSFTTVPEPSSTALLGLGLSSLLLRRKRS